MISNNYTFLDIAWSISEKSQGTPISICYFKNNIYNCYKFNYDILTKWTQMQVLPHLNNYKTETIENVISNLENEKCLVLDQYIKIFLLSHNIHAVTLSDILNKDQEIKAWWIKQDSLEKHNGYDNLENVKMLQNIMKQV